MDVRREASQIFKHFGRYQQDIGEGIIYYKFDADNSEYDEVYDEGFRRYHFGTRIPILWVDQAEAVEDYAPEGRRPTDAPALRCLGQEHVRSRHLDHRGPRQPAHR